MTLHFTGSSSRSRLHLLCILTFPFYLLCVLNSDFSIYPQHSNLQKQKNSCQFNIRARGANIGAKILAFENWLFILLFVRGFVNSSTPKNQTTPCNTVEQVNIILMHFNRLIKLCWPDHVISRKTPCCVPFWYFWSIA